jgi:hypothetical protein
MDFIDYMWIKAGVLCVAAFVGGLLGLTGQDEEAPRQEEELPEKTN